jgi:hypothetical protein
MPLFNRAIVDSVLLKSLQVDWLDSGWGLDYTWSHLMQQSKTNMTFGVVDATPVIHITKTAAYDVGKAWHEGSKTAAKFGTSIRNAHLLRRWGKRCVGLTV